MIRPYSDLRKAQGPNPHGQFIWSFFYLPLNKYMSKFIEA